MLHRIDPVCATEFAWVGKLQNDLLAAVCKPGTKRNHVTESWCLGLRSDIDATWLRSFLSRKDKLPNISKPLLEHLRTIADANVALKKQIIDQFAYNQEFAEAFDCSAPKAHPLRPVTALGDANLIKAVRGFFTVFYDPEFYKDKGFPVPHLAGRKFTRDYFIAQFNKINLGIGVCVLCDGGLGDPDLDHFYAKKVYPGLSCHQANLVPICKTCNGRNRKGEKAPLDDGVNDPMENWFHPYWRCAGGCYSVEFVIRDDELWPTLHSADALTQRRLDNLDTLIDLGERWQGNLNHIFRSLVKQLKQLDHACYQDCLSRLAQSAPYDIGELPIAILREACYRSAANGNKMLLDEIRVELTKQDPLTVV